MRAIAFLLPIVLAVGGFFLYMFLKAVRVGQFDDLDDPPQRVVHDQD